MTHTTPDAWRAAFPGTVGILAAPPCTDFSVSGAQYWPAKDLDGRTAKSMELVSRALMAVDAFYPHDPSHQGSFFWALENPVGRLPRLFPRMGKPWYFNPCDFAGWLSFTPTEEEEMERLRRKDGKGFEMEEVEAVMAANLYTKKTGIWGCFNRDMEKRRLEPIRCNAQGSPLQSYGGSSDRTKQARSNTPAGFALAFFHANNGWRPDRWMDAQGNRDIFGGRP